MRRGWRELGAGLHEFYAAPYRRTFARARRDQDDLFTMMVMSEALGVPTPTGLLSLELLPAIYEDFHDWHRRAGMDRSPLEGIGCC
nr:cory-CC-star protein [Brachybacterium phenoliresistens]